MAKTKSTGERLRDFRKQKGYTQVKVQMETGIDQSDYSKMERDERTPTLQQGKNLSRFYETSLDYIYGMTDDPSPYPRITQLKKKNDY